MICLAIAALVFGILGALFTALAGSAAYRGGIFEAEEGLYTIPHATKRVLVFTLIASGSTALAVILSTVAALVG